jgi:hypothetical protein
MKPAKFELLIKVVSWRFFSMLYGFLITLFFVGNALQSAGIVFFTGSTLTFFQWGFEIFWDKYIRENLRNVISRQQGRIDRLLRWRRGTRPISLDKYESGHDRRQEESNPLSAKNAGREWT